ncbi:unnamed protein product [Rhizophagus irregularis]|nr:unnamed protein product [Rhizophagus irregularis]
MVWREPGEELNPDCIAVTVKHSPSKMFWGCFFWNGLGPIVPLNGSVTGQTHVKVINDYVIPTLHRYFPRGNGIFQEDNAASHHAKVAVSARENAGIMMLDWPAQPPDLNPIKNLWAKMKMMVRYRSPPPSSITDNILNSARCRGRDQKDTAGMERHFGPTMVERAFHLLEHRKVNANYFDVCELQQANGIGDKYATYIVDERKNGPYKNWNDLKSRVSKISKNLEDRFEY